MDTGFISVVKVKYAFRDGNEMSGVELNLAPKVKKFIQINKDNAELMGLMHNGLIDWYNRAEYGDDIMLKCNTSKDRTYIPDEKNGDVAVNFN